MPPKPVEVVVSPCFRREYVDQIVPVIGQYPFRVVKTFHADGVLPAFLQLQADFFADGLNLLRIGSAADYKKIGKGCDATQIQNPDIDGFLRFGGANGC